MVKETRKDFEEMIVFALEKCRKLQEHIQPPFLQGWYDLNLRYKLVRIFWHLDFCWGGEKTWTSLLLLSFTPALISYLLSCNLRLIGPWQLGCVRLTLSSGCSWNVCFPVSSNLTIGFLGFNHSDLKKKTTSNCKWVLQRSRHLKWVYIK